MLLPNTANAAAMLFLFGVILQAFTCLSQRKRLALQYGLLIYCQVRVAVAVTLCKTGTANT